MSDILRKVRTIIERRSDMARRWHRLTEGQAAEFAANDPDVKA
jgi:hypothetical protein